MSDAGDKSQIATLRIFRSDGTACLRTFTTPYAALRAVDELMELKSIRLIDIVAPDDPHHGLGLTAAHELPLESISEGAGDGTGAGGAGKDQLNSQSVSAGARGAEETDIGGSG